MRKWLLGLVAMLLFVACDDGVQKAYWDNGKLKSELRYEDGKLNGECVWYDQNGALSCVHALASQWQNGLGGALRGR